MKRILLATCLAVMLPSLAMAQAANPKAKVDPKNNKVSRPVVEKVKPKLMTRDELRSCLTQQEAQDAEAKAVLAEEARQKQERIDLLAEKEAITKEGDAIGESAGAIKAEQAVLVKDAEELKAKLKDLNKKEQQAALDAYNARTKVNDEKITAHNARKNAYQVRAERFDTAIAAHNKGSKDLETRSLDQMDSVDAWKKACGNKAYDEADEIFVRKQMSAEKAAAPAPAPAASGAAK